VEKNAKSPSSQQRAGLSIAETASRNTGNPGTNLIKFSPFFMVFAPESIPMRDPFYKKEILFCFA